MRTRSRCTHRRQKCSSKVRFFFRRLVFFKFLNKFRTRSSTAALRRRQVHRERGAVQGELRVPEQLLRRAAGDEGPGPGEGRRHGDDAAGQLHDLEVPHADEERVPGAAQHPGGPVWPAGAVRRRGEGHLGAGGLPPRQARPRRAVRRHARELELQGGGGRGGVQEPQALRGEHRRRRRVTVR
jgi:hypothetical protein